MKTIVPDYYPLFRCRAGACKHTCCAGWEIDIDEKTLESYMALEGTLGDRLRSRISGGHFILDENERCPFLNENGLCDIITEKGEGALCQVCGDHPRFRNFLTGITETGLGLACEEAAELILSRKEPAGLITLEDDGEEILLSDEEAEILALRNRMLALAQDRARSIDERLALIAEEAGTALPAYSFERWRGIYLSLERLDASWTERLISADGSAPVTDETALEQLLVYLIYRHILPAAEDGDTEGRTAFVITSLMFIRDLGGDIADTARMWSGEIEYSDENTGILTDACFE